MSIESIVIMKFLKENVLIIIKKLLQWLT